MEWINLKCPLRFIEGPMAMDTKNREHKHPRPQKTSKVCTDPVNNGDWTRKLWVMSRSANDYTYVDYKKWIAKFLFLLFMMVIVGLRLASLA